jgi:hypothetical protein
MLLGVLALLGTAAMTFTTTDVLISGNYKSMARTFHAAEAGTEEARARLRASAAHPIVDAHPTQTGWRAYIGSVTNAQGKGYNASNGMHVRVDSLQNALDYTVEVQHATDAGGNILYWGDHDGDGVNTRNTTTGQNIYVLTSAGTVSDVRKTVEKEAARIPPITVPGALYVEAQTTVQGSSTNIIGTDDCGADDQPGIRTTLPMTIPGPPAEDSVIQNGSPNIVGSTPIAYNHTDMDIQTMVDSLKDLSNFAYTVSSATHTGTTTPGPGDNWGQPTAGATLQDASACSEHNVVHYDTGGTYLTLSGGVTGCGFLLVDGDLEIHGGFSWHGVVLVTGSIVFSGGGNKNITGAVLSGGSAVADVIGGNANIVFCSTAVTSQTQNRPLRVFHWKEL